MMRAVAAAVLALAVSGGAAQAAVDCSAVPDAQMAACVFANSGAPSAETLTAQKRQFIRIRLDKNEHGIVVELQRTAAGPVVMIVRHLKGQLPAMVFPFPENAWQTFVARWQTLDTDNAAWRKAEAGRRYAAGVENICLHPWGTDEESNATGVVMSLTGDNCDEVPLVQFAWDLAREALAHAPPCEALSEETFYFPANQLAECLKLRGDRRIAASVAPAVEAFAWNTWENNVAILPSATIRIGDARPIRGAANVLAAWADFIKRTDRPDVEITEIAAFENRVIAKGRIIQGFYKPPRSWENHAAFEQVWLRQPYGSFMLQKLSVGRFAPP